MHYIVMSLSKDNKFSECIAIKSEKTRLPALS